MLFSPRPLKGSIPPLAPLSMLRAESGIPAAVSGAPESQFPPGLPSRRCTQVILRNCGLLSAAGWHP